MTKWFGWDIGGAHVKLAVGQGGALHAVHQQVCPLWQGLKHLEDAFTALGRDHAWSDGPHALTMTGELCDFFENRAQGVAGILEVAARALGSRLAVYGADAWLSPAQAITQVDAVASMNWHASATWAARQVGDGWLLDVGSTTTDLIPFKDGRVCARGTTDAARFGTGELLYTGIARTPVMAVCQAVPYRGQWHGVAAEYFATMADVYRVTGELPAGADLYPTADGRPADFTHSAQRLARMVGDEYSEKSRPALLLLARYLADAQALRIARALHVVHSAYPELTLCVVGAGSGRFVAARVVGLLGGQYRDFASLIEGTPMVSAAAAVNAPAAAVGYLYAERHA